MKLEVTEQLQIKDGLHEGVIIAIEYRTDPYEYTDVVIEFPNGDTKAKLRAGYPTNVSEGSKLGKLLVRFGTKLVAGQLVDPDNLISKRCKFMTISEEKDGTTYARVLSESVKP